MTIDHQNINRPFILAFGCEPALARWENGGGASACRRGGFIAQQRPG